MDTGKFLRKKTIKHDIVSNVFSNTLVAYILSTISYAVGPLADGAVIGNFYGVDCVAAYGMVWTAVLIYALIGGVSGGGSRNLYTGLLGNGRVDAANRVFTTAMLFCGILSAILTALTFVFPHSVAGLLGANGNAENLAPLMEAYLMGFAPGVIFMNGAKVLSGYMSIDSDNKINIYAVIAMSVVDILGDLAAVFIFHGGLFALGLATALGNLVYFCVLSTHFLKKNHILKYHFEGILKEAPETVKGILKNGAPAGMTRVAGAAGGIIINHLLAATAMSETIAAYGVFKSVSSLFNALYLGVADTVWILSSVYYGEEDKEALNRLQLTAFRVGMVITCIPALILLLIPEPFARIYIGSAGGEAMNLAKEAVRVLAVCMPLYLIVYIFDDYLMGTKHLRAANLYSFFLEGGCLVPSVYIMIKAAGGRGAYLGCCLCLAVMIAAAFIYIQTCGYGKNFDARRLLLNKNFGTDVGRELTFSAKNTKGVVGMARLSKLFCQENGIEKGRAENLSLCVEEMAMNIMEHGFSDGKPHVIDIRFLIKEDELILRIRDDCVPFDPLEQYDMLRSEEGNRLKNIGIKLTVKHSRDIQYYSVSGTNNLIIRI